MMTQAFYTGISGVKTHSYGIDAVSDNLANINTVGYRGYDVEFKCLFENTKSTTSSEITDDTIGIGSQLQTTSMTQDTGSLQTTDKSTDLAIYGDGWFGVQKNNETFYTRDGAFTFDKDNDLVAVDGSYVLGTMGGNISGEILTKSIDTIPLGDVTTQQKLRFPKTLTYPQEATSKAVFRANLGVDAKPRTIGATVIDAKGVRNSLRLEFTKDPVQSPPGSQWNVKATTQTLDGKTIYDTKTGRVLFDSAGGLVSSTLSPVNNNGTPVTVDLGSAFSGVVSIDNAGIYGSSTADGTISGDLMGYDINKNGEVTATFTNGKQSSVGKIAVYHFQNNQGLERISGTRFQESFNSGKAIFFKDANGQNIVGSDISNFRLEGSNYKIEVGLTELIILQRAFDANSKSITTADEMMQKALQMDA